MLIFICCPKSFDDDEFYKIQRNAILSWQNLTIEKKIVIVGDEDGNEDFCKKNNLIYEPNVVRNEFNTPILPSIFKEGFKHVTDKDIIIYINSDIIIGSQFIECMKNCEDFVKNNKKYLMIGQRFDINNVDEINFELENWEEKLYKYSFAHGSMHGPCGIDYFIFSKSTFNLETMHPFAIGKFHWDRWLMGKCILNNIPTVNITDDNLVIHQNGSYIQNNVKKNALDVVTSFEAKRNCNWDADDGRNVNDAKYKLKNNKLYKI